MAELLQPDGPVNVTPDQVRNACRTVAEYAARNGLPVTEAGELLDMLDLRREVPA
jgi:hypothetical protein